MNNAFSGFSDRLGRATENPAFMAGLRMMGNSGPSLQPNNMFAGIGEAVQSANQIKQHNDDRRLQLAERQEAKQSQLKRKTKTLELLEKDGLGDLAFGLENEIISPEMAWEARSMRLGLSSKAARWGLDPILMKTPEGKVSMFQLSDAGELREVGGDAGLAPLPKFDKVDVGDGTLLLDENSGEREVISKNSYDPAFDKAKGAEDGKAAANRPAAERAASNAIRGLEQQSATVQDEIRIAIDLVETPGIIPNTGLGALIDALPGSPQMKLKETLLSIKANVGFDKLQAMREASPTGGALGQVSNFEVELLQAINGSLNNKLDPQTLSHNLRRISELTAQLLQDRKAAYAQDFGAADATLPGSPIKGVVVDNHVFLGGDPADQNAWLELSN